MSSVTDDSTLSETRESTPKRMKRSLNLSDTCDKIEKIVLRKGDIEDHQELETSTLSETRVSGSQEAVGECNDSAVEPLHSELILDEKLGESSITELCAQKYYLKRSLERVQ